MTDEQIKQNAKNFAINETGGLAIKYFPCEKGYIAGAHSLDEEIRELLEKFTYKIDSLIAQKEDLQEELESLRKGFYERGDKLKELMLENNKLHNSWISVKDHLLEMFVDSKGITYDFSIKVLVTNENNPNYWHVAEYYPDKNEWCCLEHSTYVIDNVTHWMPVNILKV